MGSAIEHVEPIQLPGLPTLAGEKAGLHARRTQVGSSTQEVELSGNREATHSPLVAALRGRARAFKTGALAASAVPEDRQQVLEQHLLSSPQYLSRRQLGTTTGPGLQDHVSPSMK